MVTMVSHKDSLLLLPARQDEAQPLSPVSSDDREWVQFPQQLPVLRLFWNDPFVRLLHSVHGTLLAQHDLTVGRSSGNVQCYDNGNIDYLPYPSSAPRY